MKISQTILFESDETRVIEAELIIYIFAWELLKQQSTIQILTYLYYDQSRYSKELPSESLTRFTMFQNQVHRN